MARRPATPDERRGSVRNITFLVLVVVVVALVIATIVVFATVLSRFGA